MKITAIRTFVIDCFRTNWVFVKVETDEGLSGIGEGTLEYKENALVGAVKDLEHALVGKDPFVADANVDYAVTTNALVSSVAIDRDRDAPGMMLIVR